MWWRGTPGYDEQQLGFIGHYAALNATAGRRLLTVAAEQLAKQGCTLAIGPIDGSTWHNYRLITAWGNEPAFFLEPTNPPNWPDHFIQAGYAPLARYCSTLTTAIEPKSVHLNKVAARAQSRGIRLRSLELDYYEDELQAIYPLILTSFSRNFLYTPMTEADFLAQYRPIKSYLQPALCLIAEQAGQPIGFLFALPDLGQAQRGQQIDTVIIKTVAVHPDHRVSGLGTLLVARCHEIAHELGYKRVVHALMHENNRSRKISSRFQSRVIRRYALFAKPL